MRNEHHKSVRRRLLLFMYGQYMRDPLRLLAPSDFLEDAQFTRDELAVNIHYLADRGFVELILGYHPPLFASARITANGIDCVENKFQFDLKFPAHIPEAAGALAQVPALVERLVEEVDLSPLDGEIRRNLLRDVQYLRDEFARPEARWRRHVIHAVLDWLGEPFVDPAEHVPSLLDIRKIFAEDA